MTNNPTIDGVPREQVLALCNVVEVADKLEKEAFAKGTVNVEFGTFRALRYALDHLSSVSKIELRALLDAPAVESELSRMTRRCQNAELALKVQTENYEALKAAQPQGEPVAYLFIGGEVGEGRIGKWLGFKGEVPSNWKPDDVTIKPLYDQQPAPVAFNFELAAQKLACCLDYPWEHMPEQGRDSMRGHAKAIIGAAQVAPVAMALPDRDRLRDLIAQAIGSDTYDCVRVWSAWGVGTMSEDDFVPVVDQEARLYEIADACIFEVSRLNDKS